MPSQKTAKRNHPLGEELFEALTRQEIALLLDISFAALPPHKQDVVLDQLPPDTRQTVKHVLSASQSSGDKQTVQTPVVSIAKLEHIWSNLWQEWNSVVDEAAQEEGAYMIQEEHWEPPYFDQIAFIDDLEQVAKKMQPLVQGAAENDFSTDWGFADALTEAEQEISAALPEWIEIDDGFLLEQALTFCFLEWEWLKLRDAEWNAFDFAQHILDWEDNTTHFGLDGNAFLDFFTQLSKTDQKTVYHGLTKHRETPAWKRRLENTYSYWHVLYMYYVEQYTPERYLDSLRATIPQQWQNGLPIIEDLLAKQDYQESVTVIRETLAALLRSEQVDENWTPDISLLFASANRYYGNADRLESHKNLLDFYHQSAQGLDQTQLVNALSLQLIAFDRFFDWRTMLKAFTEVAVSQQTRQALFESWRDHIIQGARQFIWSDFGSTQSRDSWWLHWLIESIVDEQHRPAWFRQKMTEWLTHLPGNQTVMGEDFNFLRLLTKDLTDITSEGKSQHPKFYQVVVRPAELSSPDHTSRQEYLREYASEDLMDRVMAYWKRHLQNFVPRPEAAQKSDYTRHAQWMAALHELAPQSYEALLQEWQVDHHRRRNLWKAMASIGFD